VCDSSSLLASGLSTYLSTKTPQPIKQKDKEFDITEMKLSATLVLAFSASTEAFLVPSSRRAATFSTTTSTSIGVATEPSIEEDVVVVEETSQKEVKIENKESKKETPTLFVSPVDYNPMEIPPDSEKPGIVENEKFDCAPSVDFWNTFVSEGNAKNLQKVQQILQRYTSLNSVKARAYWASHVLRTGYFVSNAIVGLIGHDLHERFIARRNNDNNSNEDPPQSRLQLFTSSDVGTRLLLEAFLCYEQDFAQVEKDILRLPWDAAIIAEQDQQVKLQTNHRQLNPLFVLQETSRLVSESIGVYGRQNKYKGKPSDALWIKNKETIIDKQLYPEYYLNDFHYQQMDGFPLNQPHGMKCLQKHCS
jgi:hypothetical protein